jgi:hypothetical protein
MWRAKGILILSLQKVGYVCGAGGNHLSREMVEKNEKNKNKNIHLFQEDWMERNRKIFSTTTKKLTNL